MKMDGRKRTQAAQEEIRKIAVRRVVDDGESVTEVAASLGLNRTSLYPWVAAYRAAGDASLASRKRTGRPRTLTDAQAKQVRRWIQGKDPRQYGFDFGLWTRLIVAELVRERFGVELGVTAIGALLHRLGISPQKPLHRAYERDPKAIKAWTEQRYPALKAHAKRQDAQIFFLDEAGFRSDEPRGRTWGMRGETPILRASGNRQSINAISAVTAEGHFWWDTFSGTLTAGAFAAFLTKFMKYRRRKVILVLDSHPAHRAKSVAKVVEQFGSRLELHFLPGYAPDLNPDEFVWQHLKTNGTRARPLREDESLARRVRQDLGIMQRSPHILRSFFRAPSVRYILDS